MNTTTTILPLDRQQTSRQLAYLGYQEHNPVYLRFFYPSKDPRKDADKGIKKATLDYTAIEQYQADGRGAYVVINGAHGGHTDKAITQCVALFCEWDDLPLDEQKDKWQTAGFLEPTFTVHSGGKSLHCYWVFDTPLKDIAKWKQLQKALITRLGADAANKNPSRVFRLAGAWHLGPGKAPVRSEILQDSGIRYSVTTLEDALSVKGTKPPSSEPTPVREKPSKKPRKVPTSIPISVLNLLTKEDAVMLSQGVAKAGMRHTIAVRLAKNLLGTAAWAAAHELRLLDDPYTLFVQFCRRCPQADWEEAEWLSIWESTEASAPEPSLHEEQLWERLKAYVRSNRNNMHFNYHEQADRENRQSEWAANISVDPIIPESFSPVKEYIQYAFKELYGDRPWISFQNRLYFWTGSYYKLSLVGYEKKRINRFLNVYPVMDKAGELTYPYARPKYVEEVYAWVTQALFVLPDQINPPGLNCTNGILQLSWTGETPHWTLVPHSPDFFYVYEPMVAYKPDAKSEHCDRLLSCLEPEQQAIFLRTIGASLDLATVRKHKGRKVKALLLKGDGSNGKDALREVTKMLYGSSGLTSCSLIDFKQYDQGRKFPLARLVRSRINWSSENVTFGALDKLQSLKSFVTGDPLVSEKKNRDEIEFSPRSIGIFNINDAPNLRASQKAIKSRYAILSFEKTYSDNPTQGELHADPRFRYDPPFLREEVLPAFLNKVLQGLVDLMAEDIDYTPTNKALLEVQTTNSHLYQFCLDTRLRSAPDSILTASELWEKLKQWYLDNGTLTIDVTSSGKERHCWIDQVKRADKNVKGPNQIIPRFLELFPKAKRVSVLHPSGKKNIAAIKGLAFLPPPDKQGRDNPPTPSVKEEPTPPPPSPEPVTPPLVATTPAAPTGVSSPQEVLAPQVIHPLHPSEAVKTDPYSSVTITDRPEVIDEKTTITIADGAVVVDETALNIHAPLAEEITPWTPTRSLKPYEALSVVAFDIETTGLNPEEDRVIAAGFQEKGKTPQLLSHKDEYTLLTQIFRIFFQASWDALVGHNVFAFDFPFLTKRAQAHNLTPPWSISTYKSTITSAAVHGDAIRFYQVYLRGTTQIVDTFHQAGIYDKQFSTLENYRLKDLVLTLGCRAERRLELDGQEILTYWHAHELAPIKEYLAYDLEDTLLLADFFLPTVYYQRRVVPLSLQNLAVASPAKKWEAILEAHYQAPYPEPDEKRTYQGAYTSCTPGLYRNVAKLDVSSMYPSIQLRYGLTSRKDTDKFYLQVLSYLTKARLDLKQQKRNAHNSAERLRLDAMQNAYKILINGGYGFSGTGGYSFNCMATAALVTAYGRVLIQAMVTTAEAAGATIIEVDTDGIILESTTAQTVCDYVQASLPDGITIALEWEGYAAFVPKAKNYLLVRPDGTTKRIGFFRKRNRMPLEGEFFETYFTLWVADPRQAEQYYETLYAQLQAGTYPVEKLTITQKIPKSAKALLSLGAPGERVSYYFGEKKRVGKRNQSLRAVKEPVREGAYYIEHYLKELQKWHNRFQQYALAP